MTGFDDGWFGFEFEVWQDDMCQATASATDLSDAWREAQHYALVYGQDGPVRVCQVVRSWITPPSPTRRPSTTEAGTSLEPESTAG